MREFKKGSSSNLSRFGRDQRPRTEGGRDERRGEGRGERGEGRGERGENRCSDRREQERRPRPQRDAGDSDFKRGERRSFNPNFDRSNRPYGGGERREEGAKREDGRREGYKERGDRPYSSKPRFGDKPNGERKSYGDRPNNNYGERKSYGDRPNNNYGERRSFKRSADGEGSAYPKYNPNKQIGEVRLNRYIAQSGLCSRREADDFITAGVVSVNGVVVTELGSKVKPTDEVKFNDSVVQGEKKVYLLLNKPKGYVTSNDDPHADKTVMELVRSACTERIYPVGRLDKNSVGLLIFTNDGDMTKQLTHPSHQKKKIYQVSLNKPLTRADMDAIANGLVLEDGEIHADAISYVKEDKSEVGIEIHSGRNRIVRRIFEHLGYSVQKLDRVYYAGLTKKNLRRGEWRFLSHPEVERLKSGRYE